MNEYLEIINKYEIKNLYHFTNLLNLESILKYGLCNRIYMDNNEIKYYQSDNNRYDKMLDSISLSLNTINKYMFNYKYYSGNNNWIILEFDSLEIVKSFYNNLYFCKHNASSSEIINILKNNSQALKSREAFCNMFDNNNKPFNQSEILLTGNIPRSYIKSIYTNSLNSKMIVMELVNSFNLNIPIIIKKGML